MSSNMYVGWWCLMSEQCECWVVVFDVGTACMLGGGV